MECVPDGERWERRRSIRKSLTLAQEEIAQAALAGNPKTVVVLQASFPYTTTWDRGARAG